MPESDLGEFRALAFTIEAPHPDADEAWTARLEDGRRVLLWFPLVMPRDYFVKVFGEGRTPAQAPEDGSEKQRRTFYPGRDIRVGMRGTIPRDDLSQPSRRGEAFTIVRDDETNEWRTTWWAQFEDRHEEKLCFPIRMTREWYVQVFGEEAARRGDAWPKYTFQERSRQCEGAL